MSKIASALSLRRQSQSDQSKTVLLRKSVAGNYPRPAKDYVILHVGPGGFVYSTVEDALRKPEVMRSFENASAILQLQEELDSFDSKER